MNRRDFLLSVGAGGGGTLCSILESSCGRRFIEFGVRIKGKRRRIRIERTLRTGPLDVNETLTLRRYSGRTPLDVREARLVRLAQTAPKETTAEITGSAPAHAPTHPEFLRTYPHCGLISACEKNRVVRDPSPPPPRPF